MTLSPNQIIIIIIILNLQIYFSNLFCSFKPFLYSTAYIIIF